MTIKKLLLAFVSIFLIGTVELLAQEDFTLKGKIGRWTKPAKIFIDYQEDGRRIVDSAFLNQGNFTYHGRVKAPVAAKLQLSTEGNSYDNLSTKDETIVYFAKGIILIEGANLTSAKLSGNKINTDLQRYKEASAPLVEKYTRIYQEYLLEANGPDQDSVFMVFENRTKEVNLESEAVQKSFIRSNPDSYISLSLLYEMVNPANIQDFVIPAFEKLSPALRNSSLGKQLSGKMDKYKSLAYGSVAPRISLPDTSGQMIDLTSFRGKYVLVDFWASWCVPCRQESPFLVALYQKYQSKDFTILGVSLDESKDDWLEAIHQDQLQKWTQISDQKGLRSPVVSLYALQAIPQNFLLDPDGKIVAHNLRGKALLDKIGELLDDL